VSVCGFILPLVLRRSALVSQIAVLFALMEQVFISDVWKLLFDACDTKTLSRYVPAEALSAVSFSIPLEALIAKFTARSQFSSPNITFLTIFIIIICSGGKPFSHFVPLHVISTSLERLRITTYLTLFYCIILGLRWSLSVLQSKLGLKRRGLISTISTTSNFLTTISFSILAPHFASPNSTFPTTTQRFYGI
jgi:hypothetical protein